MTLFQTSRTLLAPLFLSLALGACATDVESDLPFEGNADGIGKADHLRIDVTQIFAPVDRNRLENGGKAIITSADSWAAYFGTDAPADIDFDHEWVAFTGAGIRNTGGFGATITGMREIQGGGGIVLETVHSSPGFDCIVTQAFTTPHSIVKFDIPNPTPRFALSDHEDVVQRCSPTNEERQVELAASLLTWEETRDSIDNTYAYSSEFNSVFSNVSMRTTFVVELGVVVARHGKSQVGSETETFSEFGDEVGQREGFHAPLLIDDLYAECKNDVLSVDDTKNFMNLTFDDGGILSVCTRFNHACQDDCSRGPVITELDLQTGPQP